MKLPLARSEGLVIEELGDELLIYDLDVKQAHCLTPTAARVWRQCDGTTSTEAIAMELGLAPAELTRALEELERCELLVPSQVLAPGGLSRRELGLRVTKVAAGVATLPLILSIAAPAAAATASQIAACRILGTIESNSCGTCNQGGSPTNCCCCHYAPGKRFCAGDNADCLATGPTLPGFNKQQLNCTENPADDGI
jgi:hypothetical protein